MKKTDDMATQAAEFLKLWQEQLARQMNDPNTIHAMLSAMQAFTPRGTYDASPRRPAAAPHADDDAIRDLTQRLRAVERELVELRQSLAAQTKKPAGAGKRPVAGVDRGKRKPKRTAKRTVAKRPKPKRKK